MHSHFPYIMAESSGASAPTKWRDLTAVCRELASSLTDARPMVHLEEFSMFDAMGAIELMDEKMDTCCGVSGPMHVDGIVAATLPVELSPALVLATMERLLMSEMSYINGSSMIETFKMCIFMWPHAWPRLEAMGEHGKILLAFVKSLSKSTSVFHKFVMGADIYEEEDFHPGSKAVEGDTTDAEERMQQAKAAVAALSGAAVAAEDRILYAKMADLLELRVRLLEYVESIDATVCKALAISQKARAAPGEEKEEFEQVKAKKKADMLVSCQAVYAKVQALNGAIRAVKDNHDYSGVLFDLMSPNLMEDSANTFQPKLSKLVSNNPTRSVIAPPMTECLSQLESICVESIKIVRVIPGFCASDTSFDIVLAWCCDVSKSKYHLASRSLQWGLVHTLCSLGGIEDLLINSMKLCLLPDAYTSVQLCAEWVASFAKVAWESLKVMCMWRYKCFMKLDSNITSWNKVSEDAPRIDHTINLQLYPEGALGPAQTEIYWGTKWCMRLVSTLLESHLLLMSELDLLSGFELDSYYWFLEYVSSTRVWAIRKLREMRYAYDKAMFEFKIAQATKLIKDQKKNKNSKISGKQVKDAKRVLESPAPPVPAAPAEEMLALASNHIYKGIVRLMISLLRLGFIRAAPDVEFTSKDTRFNNRYGLYRSLSHIALVSLSDFDKAVFQIDEMESTVPAKLASASAFLSNAKAALDNLRKTSFSGQDILRVDGAASKDYSIFKYTLDTELSEKCVGLIKVCIDLDALLLPYYFTDVALL